MASTLHDPARTAPPAAPGGRRSLVAGRLRELGPRQRAVWGVVMLVLALGPAVVSAARPEQVRSYVFLEPVAGATAREGDVADYTRRILRLNLVQNTIAGTRSRYWTLLGLGRVHVDVHPAGPGGQGVRLSVLGRTRAEARDLANATAAQVTARSRGTIARRTRARAGLRKLDKARRDPHLTRARRSGLEAYRRFVAFDDGLEAGAVDLRVARPATVPADDRISRLVSKVAPDGVPRPNPLWAGFAGLLLGLALCSLWLALPPGRRARASE
jgi:hypothetical protein